MPSSPAKGGIPSSFLLGLTIGGLVVFVGLQFYKPHEKRIGELETQYKTAIRASEKARLDQQKAAQERDLALQAKDAAVAAEEAAVQAKRSTVDDYERCVLNKDTAVRESAEAAHQRDAATRAAAEAASEKDTLAAALVEKNAEVRRKDALINERDEMLRDVQTKNGEAVQRQQASDQRIRELEEKLAQAQIPVDEQALIDKAQAALRERDAAIEEEQAVSRKLTEAMAAQADARQQADGLREQLSAAKEQVKVLSDAATDIDALRQKAKDATEVQRRYVKAIWVGNIWRDFTRFEKDLLKERAKAAGFSWHCYRKGKYFDTADNGPARDAFHTSLNDILAEHGYDESWSRKTMELAGTKADKITAYGNQFAGAVRHNLKYMIVKMVFSDDNK